MSLNDHSYSQQTEPPFDQWVTGRHSILKALLLIANELVNKEENPAVYTALHGGKITVQQVIRAAQYHLFDRWEFAITTRMSCIERSCVPYILVEHILDVARHKAQLSEIPRCLQKAKLAPLLAMEVEGYLAAYSPAMSEKLKQVTEFTPFHPAVLYPELMAMEFELSGNGEIIHKKTGGAKSRRHFGAYYTPPSMVKMMVGKALEPIRKRIMLLPPEERIATVLRLSFCDPACGCGFFLLELARQVATWIQSDEGMTWNDLELPYPVALKRVIKHCLWGFDTDPMSLFLLERTVWNEVSNPDTKTLPKLVNINSLTARIPQRFDLIIGNPPFINGVETHPNDAARMRLAAAYREVSGTPDLAVYFLAWARKHRKEEGVIALVLPRPFLNAPAAAKLRELLQHEAPLGWLFAASSSRAFPGALVYTTVVILGNFKQTMGAIGDCPSNANWQAIKIDDTNWWKCLRNGVYTTEVVIKAESNSPKVSDHFEVRAGLATKEAYELRDHLIDAADGGGPALITTGLIDPGVQHWGQRTCRFLGCDYRHPRVKDSVAISKSLRVRIQQASRPKILVAGLTKRIEAFLDERGEFMGSVSTHAIFHPNDDCVALRSLLALLLSPWAEEQFHAELGANAVGGGDTVMKKSFLQNLQFPKQQTTKDPTKC